MFEKEAVDRITQQFGTSGEYNTRTRIWQDGAEFGYAKLEKENAELNDLCIQRKNRIDELETQIEKMKCCQNCKYKDLDYSFSPICISRGWDNIRGIGGNPLTFKCDEWEIN